MTKQPADFSFARPFSFPFAFGYCTNVHAGTTLVEAQANLERIATQVQQLVNPHAELRVGLWLPERAARQLLQADQAAQFRDWLTEHSLKAYTLNGFPQGDFHQAVVKHSVYEPTWTDPSRAEYTCLLADILAQLLGDRSTGSISTLPLGWPHRAWQRDDFQQAGSHLRQVAQHFHAVAERTGREIVLAIEPEPGCVLDTATDLIGFFETFVFTDDREIVRRHITVCHDICHSAVMFEPQAEALNAYAQHGIRVGKLQVSSAIEAPWHEAQDNQQKQAAMKAQLLALHEPRYLHQTTRMPSKNSQPELVEDLPVALSQWLTEDADAGRSTATTSGAYPITPWRIHFHVPIYTDRFGELRATREHIAAAIESLKLHKDVQVAGRPWFTGDYEVETYAWGVLPPELQVPDLAQGIARELAYFHSVLEQSVA